VVSGERRPLARVKGDCRQRSDSSASMKRQRSDDDYNTANESDIETIPFEFPKYHKRKIARREDHQSSDRRSFADSLQHGNLQVSPQ
jgi:hypothetical protein